MTDKHEELRKRCEEILQWQKTGILTGDALRSYAKAKYGNEHNALQCAETDTAREAFASIIELLDEIKEQRHLLEVAADALYMASTEIADWGSYASEYFQSKHGLADAVKEPKDMANAITAHLRQHEGETK